MNIIIVGGGKVGYTTAEYLSKEGHNVTIIDKDDDALTKADESLDVMCVYGNGARAVILSEAGIENADILIAVTSRDEINMVCCITAKRLGTDSLRTIARIRDPEYYADVDILRNEMGIDMVINPEYSAASEINGILQFPAAMNIESFFGGRVKMLDFKVSETDYIYGKKIAEISNKVPGNTLFVSVERNGETVIPNGDWMFDKDDKVYMIGQLSGLIRFFKSMGRYVSSIKSVMVVGGGRTGHYIAKIAEANNAVVKIIEIDHKKCIKLTENLEDVTIIEGDGTDQEVLISENVENMDAVVTVTGRDEENLITAMFAVEQGVSKVIAITSRMRMPQVINKLGLDSIISPREITASMILGYVRGVENSRGSIIEALYKVNDGNSEAISFITTSSTKFLQVPLKELQLKKDVLIGCIIHKNRLTIPHGDECIEEGDKVLVFTKAKNSIKDINDILR